MKDDGHDTCRDREAEMFEKAHDYMLQNNALRAELAALRDERDTAWKAEDELQASFDAMRAERDTYRDAEAHWQKSALQAAAERDQARALLARAQSLASAVRNDDDAAWDLAKSLEADTRAFLDPRRDDGAKHD